MKSLAIALSVLFCILSAVICVLTFAYIFGVEIFPYRGLNAIGSRLAVMEAKAAENAARLDILSGDIFRLTEKSELRWSYYEGLDGMVEALLMKGHK
jgi:hypothetical protein